MIRFIFRHGARWLRKSAEHLIDILFLLFDALNGVYGRNNHLGDYPFRFFFLFWFLRRELMSTWQGNYLEWHCGGCWFDGMMRYDLCWWQSMQTLCIRWLWKNWIWLWASHIFLLSINRRIVFKWSINHHFLNAFIHLCCDCYPTLKIICILECWECGFDYNRAK